MSEIENTEITIKKEYYATIDGNGFPTGYYCNDIHEVIPENAILITEEQWIDLVNNPHYRHFVDGVITECEPPEQKITWDAVRSKRDSLLSSTDWTQIPDAPLTQEQKAAFISYRRALRDITSVYFEPELVVWPEKPL